jgi:precorrin-2/cobalt-factor-2 C20-methyltransferase
MNAQPTTPLGTLYGVGVGPGAPDLLTLRALKVIQEADVLAIPRPSDFGTSVAWSIVKPHVDSQPIADTGAKQERLFLTFPMSKDPDILVPAWHHAFQEIQSRLRQGLSVAFLTQGDPFVYSTFIYLQEKAREMEPLLNIEIIPGVTSLSAVPAAAGIPLADGQERIAVIPATYGLEELRSTLRAFDAVLIMKVSSCIRGVIKVLEEEGLLGCSTYVERATSKDQKVVHDLTQIKGDRCVYFSMVFVHKKLRSGVLSGKTSHGKGLQAQVHQEVVQ